MDRYSLTDVLVIKKKKKDFAKSVWQTSKANAKLLLKKC